MRSVGLAGFFVTATLLATSVLAGSIPRSAHLVKDAGNQFLAAKKYADSIDCYFQAIEIHPEFAEAHYNLGVAFLKGYKARSLAVHHFEQYLKLAPDAPDVGHVQALIAVLQDRMAPVPEDKGEVVGVVADRLLVSGTEWVRSGDRIEVAAKGEAPRAHLIASYVYADAVLTQRIRDQKTLSQMRPGLLAVNTSVGDYDR